MQTFATLGPTLAAAGKVLRAEPHVRTVEIAGHAVEVQRIEVGGAEWAVVSVLIGAHAPARHAGLGAIVACNDGWALRLSLPVAEVQPRTITDVMKRLALEVGVILRDLIPDRAPLQMWAD